MLESYYAINYYSSGVPNFSEQYLINCDPYNYGCDGGNTILALWYLRYSEGMYFESELPYIAQKGECTLNYPIRNMNMPKLSSTMPFERIKSNP